MPEERLKLAVFIDFDNIQIGVKDTLGKDFDVSLVLEALKERGEVVAKIAYGDWARAGDYSRQMTQHAIQMVQRSVTPRGDKNGADINLALDALEMAFTRHHITAFAIVGGDSDFMALVEKLKQFDKQVFVVGGRSFTSNILQKNCTEFVAYENLLRDAGRAARARRGEGGVRTNLETHALSEALPNIQRALKILADRGVAPQLGLLKSTLLQLDSTFTERDYGTGSFLEFMQKVERAGRAHLRRTERGYLVEPAESNGEGKGAFPLEAEGAESGAPTGEAATASATENEEQPAPLVPNPAALELVKQALAAATEKVPGRPLYMRQVRQRMRALDPNFDERQNGYQGTLDLLRHAQREGILKLARDHKGIWRIYSLGSAAPPPAALESVANFATEPAFAALAEAVGNLEQTVASEEAETVMASEAQEFLELTGKASTGANEPALPPPAEQEPAHAPERKVRKPRATKSASKGTRRRSTPHRRPPENA